MFVSAGARCSRPPPRCEHTEQERTRGIRKRAGIVSIDPRVRAQATHELEASRAEVWGFLTEPYHFSDWWPGITSVRPDRRGLSPGARWEVVGPRQPTLFRKAYSSGLLLVRDVYPYERASWYLTVMPCLCGCDRRSP